MVTLRIYFCSLIFKQYVQKNMFTTNRISLFYKLYTESNNISNKDGNKAAGTCLYESHFVFQTFNSVVQISFKFACGSYVSLVGVCVDVNHRNVVKY